VTQLHRFIFFINLICAPVLLAEAPVSGSQSEVERSFDVLCSANEGSTAPSRLIVDNREAWYARWYLVDHARRSVDFSTFEVESDVFTLSFLGLLLKKANEGVRVRLMLDFRGAGGLLGSRLGQQYLRDLVGTGHVEVRIFNPLYKSITRVLTDPLQVVASNHQKLLLVDGEWLLSGSRNLTRHYFGAPEDNARAFRDVDVIVQSPQICADAQRVFETEFSRRTVWIMKTSWVDPLAQRKAELDAARKTMEAHILGRLTESGGSSQADFPNLPEAFADELFQHRNLIGYANYSPLDGATAARAVLLSKTSKVQTFSDDLQSGFASLLNAAREEILIESPYVVITEKGRKALADAGRRGVKIRILTNSPESTDQLITQVPLLQDWKSLLSTIPNLRLAATNGRRTLHSKVYLLDRKVALIGSYNFDELSEKVNAEAMLALKSSESMVSITEQVLADLSDSTDYLVRIQPNGSVEGIRGPEDLATPATRKALSALKWLAFLRPIL